MNGFGDFIWTNGRSFTGYYVKDLKEGLGLFYWSDPVEIYFGFWLAGQRNGPAYQITDKGAYYSLWQAGKQIKVFLNKEDAKYYCSYSSKVLNRQKKFLDSNIESLIKVYTSRKDYFS